MRLSPSATSSIERSLFFKGINSEAARSNSGGFTFNVLAALAAGFFTFASKTGQILTVKIINRSPHDLPRYETPGSAGMDLRAVLDAPLTLPPMGRAMVPTGLFIELPAGFEAQIRPRSGLAAKRGITLLNSPGTIDSDYRGEIKCIMVNLSGEPQTLEPGERIAQMVVARYEQVAWQPVDMLEESRRGAGGFGSTGKG